MVTKESGGVLSFLKPKKKNKITHLQPSLLKKSGRKKEDKYSPFKNHSKRGYNYSSCYLSIEAEDVKVHTAIKGSFSKQKHACI